VAPPPISALVCEGRDDVAAIRALLKDRGATRRREDLARGLRPGVTPPEHWALGQALLIVQSAGAKESLAEAALDWAQGGASERPGRVIVCFDPDDDPASRELEFLLGGVQRAGRSSDPERVGEDWRIRVSNRDVLLTPAPWRSSASAPFDHLPDHHCLERVLISALKNSSIAEDLKAWTESSTSALSGLVNDHGWKRAFRLWSAAVDPAESFVDRLLQRDDTRLACLSALRTTPVNSAIELALQG